MILLSGQSLTPARKLRPEALGLNLEEKKSTATLELGPEDPEIAVGTWMLDDEPGCGEGIVWRVRSADMNYNTETRSLSLEHIINTLQDQVLFGETTWEDIAGAGASACSAKQAIQYVLSKQSLWRLGDFDFDDIAWPYQFNGDTLYSAIQTVTNSCPDSCWEYDLSRIPFRLHVRRIPDETTCEMRAGRNIKTLKRVIDRSGMYTRFYPIGKDDLHLTGEYISKNESTYGMVAKVETFSGAETESALRSWAWERLKRHCQPKVTVTIGGLELSESTGEPLDKLTMNRKCRVPLPEFATTITERIIRIRVTDKIRKPEEVTVTLGNELPDLASIVGEVEKEQASGSGGGGRGGMKKAGEDHAWFVDTDTHVGMVAEAIIGHGPDGVDWSRVAEVIVDGDGIHNRVTRAEGYLVTMEAKIDLTEEKLRAEFNNIADSLRSELEMSAESLRVEFENLNNSTRSELLITSESLKAEFTNEINSTRSEFIMTSESMRVEFENEVESVRSQVEQTDRSWKASVAGVAGADGKVTAASIGVAINENGSNAFINADHIHLTGNTLLSGQLTVEDGALKVLTALAVGNTTGKIVTINNGKINVPDTLQISSGAELLFVGSQTGERYSFTAANVGNILVDAAIANSVLTVSRKNGNTALSVGVSGNSLVFTDGNGQTLSFSKATTLEGAWSSGKLTVSAYQTNNGTQTLVRSYVSNHELSLNGNGSSSFSVEMKTQDTGESAQTVRDSKYIYLHENVNGASSTVVAGENADGTGSVGSISTRATYNAGKTAGNAEGQAEYKALVRSRFKSSSGGYYIEGYESNSGNSISGSDTTYKLGTSGSEDSTVVQIQNPSGTKISETAELSVGSLYTDGYTAGNANRASQVNSVNVSGATDEEEPVQKTLIANTKYKILSQYKDAEGNWNDGGTYIVKTPANSPGTATIGHQDAIGATKTRGRPLVYAKLNGTTKQTLNLYLHRSTYTNDDGDTGLHCVDIHAKVDAQAATTDPIIGRISTETVYDSGYSAGYNKGYTLQYTEITGGSVSWDSGSISGRYNCGSITRPDSRSYVKFSVTCRGVTRMMYIVVN